VEKIKNFGCFRFFGHACSSDHRRAWLEAMLSLLLRYHRQYYHQPLCAQQVPADLF
jgi:hypothetical protein